MPAQNKFDPLDDQPDLHNSITRICTIQTEALSKIIRSDLPIERIKEIAATALSDAVLVSKEVNHA